MATSNNANVVLSTYALGSCVGIICYDAQTMVGGVLHIMLPDSKLSPDKAKNQPSMFADTGIRHFFRSLQGMGADTRRQKIMIAGGASVLSGSDVFKIGDRNVAAVKQIFGGAGMRIVHCDCGGLNNRTVHLTLATGEVEIKQPTGIQRYSLQ